MTLIGVHELHGHAIATIHVPINVPIKNNYRHWMGTIRASIHDKVAHKIEHKLNCTSGQGGASKLEWRINLIIRSATVI